MSSELFGKWYVYRYYDATILKPVLKAAETTLEISGQTETCCLARFEVGGWTEPVEIEMTADETGGWQSNPKGSFGFFEVRWTRVEPGGQESAMLMGRVINKEEWLTSRDFFVAVRSRRMYQLPELPFRFRFGGAYLTPFEEDSTSKKLDDGIELDLDQDLSRTSKRTIELWDTIYELDWPKRFQGGFEIVGKDPEAIGTDRIVLWLLPAAAPEQPGPLLAIGFNEYHQDAPSGPRPSCEFHLHLC